MRKSTGPWCPWAGVSKGLDRSEFGPVPAFKDFRERRAFLRSGIPGPNGDALAQNEEAYSASRLFGPCCLSEQEDLTRGV